MPIEMQSILDTALGLNTPEQKKQNVEQASAGKTSKLLSAAEAKRAKMGGTPQQLMNAAIGSRTNTGQISADDYENDARFMSPYELMRKYGSEGADNIMRGEQDAVRDYDYLDREDDRPTGVAIKDGALSLFSGAVKGIVSPIAAVSGLVSTQGGVKAARDLADFDALVESGKSDFIKENRQASGMRSALTQRDNEQQELRDIAAGDGTGMAGLRRYGRDAADGFAEGFDNQAGMLDTAASGVGSLLSGSVTASALRKVGSKILATATGGTTSKVSSILSNVGSKAAMPAVIGAQEGGSAFEATVNEMLNRGFSEDEANAAGLKAAAIAAPSGAVAGLLVSKLESAPFRVGSVGQFAGGLVREGVEEGAQGTTGTLASNLAIADYDKNQDVMDGVGTAAGQGAAAGILTQGVMQGPSAALKSALEVTHGTAKAGIDVGKGIYEATAGTVKSAAKTALKPVYDVLKARYDNVMDATAKASPLSNDRVNTVVSAAVNVASTIRDSVNKAVQDLKSDDGDAPARDQYVQDIADVVQFDPAIAENESIPEKARAAFTGVKSKFEAIAAMSGLLKSSEPGSSEQLFAARFVHDIVAKISGLVKADTSTFMGSIAGDSEAAQDMSMLRDTLVTMNQSDAVQSVVSQLDDVAKAAAAKGTLAPVPEEALGTPEGDAGIANIIAVAEFSPVNSNPEAIKEALRHADSGKLKLSPSQRAVLVSTSALLEAKTAHIERLQSQGLATNADFVTKDIVNTKETGAAGSTQLSLGGHVGLINNAVRNGEDATPYVRNLLAFARGMQNKVAALNEHIASGKWGKESSTKYQVHVGNGAMRPSYEGVSMLPTSAGSVKFAQAVAADAATVGELANKIAEAFPDLGMTKIDLAQLDQTLVGRPDDVAKAYTDNRRAAAQAKRAEARKPVENTQPVETMTVEQYADLYLAGKGRGSKRMEQFAANNAEAIEAEFQRRKKIEDSKSTSEPAETGQPEGGDKSADVESVVVEEVEAKAEPVEPTEPEVKLEGMDLVFPDLIGSSQIKDLFALPDEAISRTTGTGSPMAVIEEALVSEDALAGFIGSELKNEVTEETLSEYAKLLARGKKLTAALNKNLETILNASRGGRKISEYLLDDTLVVTVPAKKKEDPDVVYSASMLLGKRNFRGLHLVENQDGKLGYNPELLESAVLAALQWYLSADNYKSVRDEEDAAAIANIPEEMVGMATINQKIDGKTVPFGLVDWLNRGLTLVEAKRSLADKIEQYWGLRDKSSAEIGITRGISESIAAELLEAMNETGLVKEETAQLREEDGVPAEEKARTLKLFIPEVIAEGSPLLGFTDAIDQAVLTKPEPEYNIGSPPPQPVAKNQLRTPEAEITDEQVKAIEFERQQKHFANMPMFQFLKGITRDNVLDLFAAGKLDNRLMNVEDRKKKEGLNLTFGSAYDTMIKVMAELEGKAGKAGISPDMLPVYFDYAFTKVNRMQMLGLNNIQASKLMREVLLGTRTTLDITKGTKGYSAFGLGLAQALGVKVERVSRDEAVTAVMTDLEKKYATSVQNMQAWLKDQSEPFSDAMVATLKNELGGGISPVAVHAIMEYARFKNADAAGRKEFTTGLYVEADGKTNGPINAMILATAGKFTTKWLRMVRKGGLFLGLPGMSLNEFMDKDDKDLYTTATGTLQEMMAKLVTNINGNADVRRQMQHLTTLLTMFVDDAPIVDGKIKFKRGIAKNPLTITIYGSGARGIASNLTGEILEGVYERLSEAMQAMADNTQLTFAEAMFPDADNATEMAEKFNQALTGLQSGAVYNKEGQYFYNASGVSDRNINPETHKFNAAEIKNIEQNVLTLLVEPLRDAVNDTVGESLIESMELLRKTTQAQSIALQFAFKKAILARIAEKQKDPTWSKDNFLSKKELREIFDTLKPLAPMISNGSQNYFIAGTQAADVGDVRFGSTYQDKLRTPGNVRGFSDVGVGGIPATIIGWGDGLMMQILSTMEDAPEGTLKVFDGMHIKLDKLEEHSEKANQAVHQTWMGNPLQATSDAFRSFLEAFTVDPEDIEQLKSLSAALGTEKRSFKKADQKYSTPEVINAALKALSQTIAKQAFEIEVRHRVMARVDTSVDQMASVAAPYQHKGEVSFEGMSNNQMETALNRMYAEEEAKLKAGSTAEAKSETVETVSENIAEELQTVGRLHSTGARVVSFSALRNLVRKIKAPEDQRGLLGDILRTLTTKEYKIIYGSAQQLEDYADQKGISLYGDRGKMGVNGVTFVESQTIFLIDPSSEVLLHELVHAATYEKLIAYYEGGDIGANSDEQKAAIKRLEALANQFYKMDTSEFTSADLVESYEAAVQEMQYHVKRGNKAAALNEFMAWGLANTELSGLLSATKSVSPLVQLAQDVVAALRKLIWGRRKMPAVKQDMLSNLRFNTNILLQNKQTPSERIGVTAVYMRKGYGLNKRLADFNKAISWKIVRHLERSAKDLPAAAQQLKVKQEVKKITSDTAATIAVMDAGFKMDKQEKTTFQLVVSVMRTAIELDPNALARVQDLYSHVTKELRYEDFMKDPESTDLAEIEAAERKYRVVIGARKSLKDAQGRTNLLSVFLGLAIVNEEFRDILSGMAVPVAEKRQGRTLDAILTNAGNWLMDKLTAKMSGEDSRATNVKAAMDGLIEQIEQTALERETFIEKLTNPMGVLTDRINDGAVNMMQKGSKAAQRLSKNIKASSQEPMAIGAAKALNVMAGLIDADLGSEIAEGIVGTANTSKLNRPMYNLIKDFVGRTESNAPVYDMIKMVRGWVQQKRQKYREGLPKIIASKFSREITKDEWSAMYWLGRGDFAALKGYLNNEQMLELLQDPSTAKGMIEKLEAEIASMDPKHSALMIQKAKQLANYMNTGQHGNNLLRNAKAVAELINEAPLRNDVTDAMVQTIDRLVSLYAFEAVPESAKTMVTLLAQNEPEGVTFTFDMLIGRRTDELAKIKGTDAELNHYKGYMPIEYESDASLVVEGVGLQDSRKLIEMSYTAQENYAGSSLVPGSNLRAYFFARTSGKPAFSQGIFQTAQMVASGVDPMTGFSQEMTAGRITDPNEVARITRQLKKEKATNEPVMAIFDSNRNVVAYEMAVDPKKLEQLDRKTNLSETIGIWRGRQLEESEANHVNEALIFNLHAVWEKQVTKDPSTQNQYVDVFDPAVLKSRPILADAVRLLTPVTRAQIAEKFGNKFWVREDLIDDALGYRSASVSDIWSGNTDWSPKVQQQMKEIVVGIAGNKAYDYMVRGEKILQNFITDARVMIVVKSVVVPTANMVANVYQLWSRGVPMAQIAKGMPRKAAEVNFYVRTRQRLDEVEAEILAAEAANKTLLLRKLKSEARSILDSHARLSIWPLIVAGEFSAISDGTLDRNEVMLTDGKLGEYVEKLVDKLPPSVKTAGRYAIISRDTALFQGLQKAVEYGDFLGKAILYDHLTKDKGKTQLEALAQITEEFVNYDRLPGRFRGYAESIGLVWFYNFKIRSVKIALSMIRNNPFHVLLATTALPDIVGLGSIGTPVGDNLLSVALGANGLDASLGVGMAFNAASLHPYWNLVN